MTSISSLGSSNAWSSAIQSQRSQQSVKLAEKLLANFDADGNGSLNETELQSLMDDIGSRTGQSGGSSAKDLLSSSDSNADGSLSTDELEAAPSSMLPPPRSTMDFAQSRGAGQSDDLFSKVDSDGSGDVSSDELTALLQKMNGQESVSEEDAAALFSQLDSDDDGSLSQAEFDAARPQNAGGMPPPPPAQASASTESDSDSTGTAAASGVGGAGGAGGSTTTVYDELDTNEDGTVSLAERLAGAAEDAADAALNVVDQLKQSTESWTQNARNALLDTAHRAYQAASGEPAAARSTYSYTV